MVHFTNFSPTLWTMAVSSWRRLITWRTWPCLHRPTKPGTILTWRTLRGKCQKKCFFFNPINLFWKYFLQWQEQDAWNLESSHCPRSPQHRTYPFQQHEFGKLVHTISIYTSLNNTLIKNHRSLNSQLPLSARICTLMWWPIVLATKRLPSKEVELTLRWFRPILRRQMDTCTLLTAF